MRNLFWRPLVGLTMVALCCTGMAWGQDDDGAYGAQLLPPETRLMFSISDVAGLKESLQNSSLGKMLADPEFKPFLDQFQSKIDEASEKVKAELGVTLEELHNLVSGEFTFAVIEAPARKLNAVLLVDCGEHEETLKTLLGKLDEALKDAGGKHATETVSEVEINVFEFPKTDDVPYNKFAYFATEGYFVAASDVAGLKAVLDRWEGESKNTLASDEVYAYVLEKCTTGEEEPLVSWYLDLVGLLKTGVGMVQGQNPQAGLVLGVLPILGVDQLKGIGGGMDIAAGDFESVSKTFIYAEQPASGLLGLFQFPAVAQEPPKWVSSDATMFFEANWDVNAAYLAVESVIDSFQGPGATGKLLDAVSMEDNGPMIHPKNDVIDYLSGEIAVMTQSGEAPEDSEVPATPDFVVALGLKDTAGMKATLDKASKADGFPGKATEIEGQTVYEIPTAEEQSVFVGVIGEQLIAASSSDGIESVIAGKSEEALVDSEDYKAIAEFFPRVTSMISFAQQDTQMQAGYEMLKKQDPAETQGIDFSLLPDFEALLKYTKPSGSYAVPDAKGGLFVGFTLADE